MLLIGAGVGLYLTKMNQDLRQRAAEPDYECKRATRVSSSTNSSSITITQAMMDACEEACPNAHLYVARYKCSGIGLTGGCQDNGEIVSNDADVGDRFNAASASCGTTQIDVGCRNSANSWGNVAFASKTYANACGGGGGGGDDDDDEEEEETLVCGERGCSNNGDCASGLTCISANNGNKYCGNPSYQAACAANPSQKNCCEEPETSLVCGERGCNTNSDCSSGLACVTAINGNKYCANPAYRTACAANPSQESCCTEPEVGPQCLEIQMFDVSNGTSSLVTGDDDESFVPGETTVRFVCGNTEGDPLPSDYFYRFRIYEPCGSDNHTTPLELDADSGGTGVNYDLELSGDYAAQCAVCTTTGGSTSCDFEAYTPAACDDGS